MQNRTAKAVASYMLDRLNEDDILYQEVVVYEIQEKFGDDFVYINQNDLGDIGVSRQDGGTRGALTTSPNNQKPQDPHLSYLTRHHYI